jgi:hypothetical protein
MKSLIVAALLLGTTFANAAEVLVLDTQLPISRSFATRAFARFYMDQTTGEGFAKITATEERYIDMNPGCRVGPNGQCFPMPPQTMPVIILEETVKIEDLALVGDKLIYNGAEGEVSCGTLGVSRVFKKPTIYLSGKCSLEARIKGSNLKVNFITK